jgi:hypothetical protein
MTTISNLGLPFVLTAGHSHEDPTQGTCAAAAIGWLVHGRHTDDPPCVCPILCIYVRLGNDLMDDTTRQRFIPFLHRLAGSRSRKHERARLRILWLAAVRIFTPRALDAVSLHDRAATLRALSNRVSASQARRAAARAAEAARSVELAAKDEETAQLAARAVEAASWAQAAAKAAQLTPGAAAEAAAWSAGAAAGAVRPAVQAAETAWDHYFAALDEALRAGPEGEPWSADVIEAGHAAYRRACEMV